MKFELPRPVLEYLLDSTVTASILVLLIGILQVTIGRRLSPAWRFLLWMPVLLRLLVPIFPESSLSLYNLLRWGGGAAEVPVVVQPVEFTPSTEPPVIIEVERLTEEERSQWVLHDWGTLLGRVAFLLWVTVAGGLIMRLVVGTAWLQWRLRRDARESAGELKGIMAEAARAVRLGRPPRLRDTGLVESPAVFGLFRPWLLLPHGFAERLEPPEIRHVFLHEAAHLKRRDLVVNWLMALAQAIHWFNPLVWLAFRQMRIERELACDGMALRAASGEDPRAYGRTILRLLEGVTARPRLAALVGIAEEKHSAKRRLQQIATFSPDKRRYWIAIPILLVLIIAGLTNARDTDVEDALPNETGDTAASTGNEPIVSTSTNAVYASERQQAIARRLQEIIIPEFYVPGEVPLKTVLEHVSEEAKKHDPERIGVTLRIREKAPALDLATGVTKIIEPSERLEEFLVKVDPKLTNVRLSQVLDVIARAARPPGAGPGTDRRTRRVKYSVEDYGVAFSERDVLLTRDVSPPETTEARQSMNASGESTSEDNKAAKLYTRTYRLNAEAFLNKLEELQGPVPKDDSWEGGKSLDYASGIQSAVRRFLASAGIDFSASPSPLSPAQSEKAIFFNDRAGGLFVRAPLSDMDKVEQALLDLKLPPPASRDVSPPQVTIETRAVEFETAADFNRFMTRLVRLQKEPRAVLTRAEFDELMENLEKAPGTDILKLPRITTLSGRAVRVSVGDIGEPALVIDLHPEYHPLDQTFTLTAAGYLEDDSENKQSQRGVLYNGQTLVLGLPDSVEHFSDWTTKVHRLYFITPVLIDMAGNLIKNPGDPREEVPPQAE